MSCPLSQFPDKRHDWDRYDAQGKLKSKWRCFRCGRTRKLRRTTERYKQSLAKGRTK